MVLEAGGERFRFYYEPKSPQMLHITHRHETTSDDAILTFFDGTTIWEEDYLRFRTETERHVLLWTRHTHDEAVIVISCFRKGEM